MKQLFSLFCTLLFLLLINQNVLAAIAASASASAPVTATNSLVDSDGKTIQFSQASAKVPPK